MVEKLDFYKVKVQQLAVTYQSGSTEGGGGSDWFLDKVVQHEDYDNPDALPITWQYSEQIQFQSRATWQLLRGIRSSLLPLPKITVEFPVAEEGSRPLQVSFDNCQPDQSLKTAEKQSMYHLKNYVTVQPWSTTRARAVLHTCHLHNAMFATDLTMCGSVKITGHKKRKNWQKQEISASIEDILHDNPSFQTVTLRPERGGDDAQPGEPPGRRVCYRLEGVCTGEVALSADIDLSHLQTQV